VKDEELFSGRTYDDFLFRPQKGTAASRSEVRLTTQGTRGITLELPILSANMDSVTESRMARVLALEGGLGVIHRGMSKVGIGPGRGCRTRVETAAGVPQLQAVHEAWSAVGASIPIIADGGVHNDKDLFLALICGASSVMLGSLLSGTDEAPGTVILDPATGEKRKIYRGMTSPQAVFEALYDDADPERMELALETPAEGQEVQVPYGSVRDVLQRMRGHLRSAVSYGGESSLAVVRAKVLADPASFLIRLSAASRQESFER